MSPNPLEGLKWVGYVWYSEEKKLARTPLLLVSNFVFFYFIVSAVQFKKLEANFVSTFVENLKFTILKMWK